MILNCVFTNDHVTHSALELAELFPHLDKELAMGVRQMFLDLIFSQTPTVGVDRTEVAHEHGEGGGQHGGGLDCPLQGDQVGSQGVGTGKLEAGKTGQTVRWT